MFCQRFHNKPTLADFGRDICRIWDPTEISPMVFGDFFDHNRDRGKGASLSSSSSACQQKSHALQRAYVFFGSLIGNSEFDCRQKFYYISVV